MDFFDSDDDGETFSVPAQREDIGGVCLNDILSLVFIALMRVKPLIKASRMVDYNQPPRPLKKIGGHSIVWVQKEVVLPRRIAFVFASEAIRDGPAMTAFAQKLKAAKFTDVTHFIGEDPTKWGTTGPFDVIVSLANTVSKGDNKLIHAAQEASLLVAGGHFLALTLSASQAFPDYQWVNEEAFTQPVPHSSASLLLVRRRAVLVNETAALYWTRNSSRLSKEREWIERISAPLSVAEREHGVLSDHTHHRAVAALSQYGVAILPGLIDRSTALNWGETAKTDMHSVLRLLQEKKDIDLLHPGMEEATIKRIDNFHELSMREALRCDVRNVPQLRSLHDSVYGAGTGASTATSEWPVYEKINTAQRLLDSSFIDVMQIRSRNPIAPGTAMEHSLPASQNVRYHPAILSVLYDSMNPPNQGSVMGNWGRWNFEGPGPEAPIPFRVGRPGVIFSFPGCADQTIHADTSQLVNLNVSLPPHYVNLFIASSDARSEGRGRTKVLPVREGDSESDDVLRGFSIGHTAFVAGSQDAALTEKIMTQEGGQEELESRLVRPQLDVGDALLFDCRVLHFGLANEFDPAVADEAKDDTAGWRLMMYVNYHQAWFHDPKNWNDNEKLFT